LDYEREDEHLLGSLFSLECHLFSIQAFELGRQKIVHSAGEGSKLDAGSFCHSSQGRAFFFTFAASSLQKYAGPL
jgi:hypothetical protein